MRKSFLDKVAASPNVPKYAVKSLATAIEVYAKDTPYTALTVLKARNEMHNVGFRCDLEVVAGDIVLFSLKMGLGYLVVARLVAQWMVRFTVVNRSAPWVIGLVEYMIVEGCFNLAGLNDLAVKLDIVGIGKIKAHEAVKLIVEKSRAGMSVGNIAELINEEYKEK